MAVSDSWKAQGIDVDLVKETFSLDDQVYGVIDGCLADHWWIKMDNVLI